MSARRTIERLSWLRHGLRNQIPETDLRARLDRAERAFDSLLDALIDDESEEEHDIPQKIATSDGVCGG